MIAPASTPPAIVARLHDEIGAILALPDMRDKLATQVMEPVGRRPRPSFAPASMPRSPAGRR